MKEFKITSYALARSFLALGAIITLLGSGKSVLFDKHYFDVQKPLLKWNFFHLFGYENTNWSIGIASLILFCVIIGIYPRIIGIFQWWISISIFHIVTLSEGGDQIAVILTFLLIPLTLYDKRRNHWFGSYNPSKYTVGRIVLLLISIQMSVLYFDAAIGKFGEPEWANGTAFYYWATNNGFSEQGVLSLLLSKILVNKWIVAIFTWGAIFLELMLAMAIFIENKKTKMFFLIAGLAFHFTIIVIFGLISFFLAMAAGILLYLTPINQDLSLLWKQVFCSQSYNSQTIHNS